MTANESLHDRYPAWGSFPHHTVMRLNPLSDDEVLPIIKNVLEMDPVNTMRVARHATDHLKGNPLAIEEFALAFMERTRENIETRYEAMPESLEQILYERLSRLDDALWLVLEKASCIGQIFWLDTLSTMIPELTEKQIQYLLSELERRDLIISTIPSSFSATAEYRIKHAESYRYIQRYAECTPEDHATIASWRITHSAQRVNEYAGLLAARYSMARKTAQATEYYIRAGKQATNVGAMLEAAYFYRKALDNVQDESSSKQITVLFALGTAYWQLGRFEDALPLLVRCIELSEDVGDMLVRAKVFTALGSVAHELGEHELARDYFDEGLTIARQVGDRHAISENLMQLGDLALDRDDLDLAQQCFMESLTIYQTMRHEHRISTIFLSMSRLSMRRANLKEAESLAVTALRMSHRSNAIQLMLRALLQLSAVQLRYGHPDIATDIVTTVYHHPFVSPLIRAKIDRMITVPRGIATDTAEFNRMVEQFL